VVAILSLGYVVRGVDSAAAQESFKARVPIFGRLSYIGTTRPDGDSVGREDGYRGYIAGPHIGAKNAPKQYPCGSSTACRRRLPNGPSL